MKATVLANLLQRCVGRGWSCTVGPESLELPVKVYNTCRSVYRVAFQRGTLQNAVLIDRGLDSLPPPARGAWLTVLLMFSRVVDAPLYLPVHPEAGMTSPPSSLGSRWESGGSMSVWSASPWWPSTCTSLPRSSHLPCRSGTAPARCSASGTGTSSTEVGERLWAPRGVGGGAGGV